MSTDIHFTGLLFKISSGNLVNLIHSVLISPEKNVNNEYLKEEVKCWGLLNSFSLSSIKCRVLVIFFLNF